MVGVRLLVLGALLAGCLEGEGLGEPPPSFTGAVTSGLPTAESDSDSQTESASETGDGDGDGDEDGDGTLGEACEADDDCSSQYVCIDERCREPCSQTTPCEDGDSEQLCTVTDDPNISVCLDPCTIFQNDCDAEGEACKRAPSVDGDTVAVCLPNPGNGGYGAACTSDGECAPGFLCSPALTHVEPCLDGAAFCCTSVCDVFEPNCAETEPICVQANIVGQENVGYCGAPG